MLFVEVCRRTGIQLLEWVPMRRHTYGVAEREDLIVNAIQVMVEGMSVVD